MGRFHSGVWGFWRVGLRFISAQKICFPSMLYSTLFVGEMQAVCASVLREWCMTESHDNNPGPGWDCEHLLKFLSFEINLQGDPWSVRASKAAREDDLQKVQPLSVSKLHTVLSIHIDLLKIYNLAKFVWNLVAMNECIHLTKAILPWSPRSGLLLQGM